MISICFLKSCPFFPPYMEYCSLDLHEHVHEVIVTLRIVAEGVRTNPCYDLSNFSISVLLHVIHLYVSCKKQY